jgi:hypothetical protein
VVEHDVLEVGGEVDLRGLDPREVAERVRGKRAGAVLDRTGEPVLLPRDPRQAARAWRSSFTSAMEPSGSTTPPCDVPVCTEILLIPSCRPSAARLRL